MRHAQIRQDRRLVALELERLAIEHAGFLGLVELVEDRAFGRKQLPVGIFRRLGAPHGIEGGLELPGAGQRLAVGREHLAVLRMRDRELAHDGERLVGPAVHLQQAGILHCDRSVGRVLGVGLAKLVGRCVELRGRHVLVARGAVHRARAHAVLGATRDAGCERQRHGRGDQSPCPAARSVIARHLRHAPRFAPAKPAFSWPEIFC